MAQRSLKWKDESEGPNEQPVAPDHIHVITCLDHYRRHLTLNHRAPSRRAQLRSQHGPSVHPCPALSSPLGIKGMSKIATSIGRQEGADCSSHTEKQFRELKGFLRVTQFKEEAISGGSIFNIYAVSTANRYKCGWAKGWKKKRPQDNYCRGYDQCKNTTLTSKGIRVKLLWSQVSVTLSQEYGYKLFQTPCSGGGVGWWGERGRLTVLWNIYSYRTKESHKSRHITNTWQEHQLGQ